MLPEPTWKRRPGPKHSNAVRRLASDKTRRPLVPVRFLWESTPLQALLRRQPPKPEHADGIKLEIQPTDPRPDAHDLKQSDCCISPARTRTPAAQVWTAVKHSVGGCLMTPDNPCYRLRPIYPLLTARMIRRAANFVTPLRTVRSRQRVLRKQAAQNRLGERYFRRMRLINFPSLTVDAFGQILREAPGEFTRCPAMGWRHL